jgi:hypothetical protein
LFEATHNQAEKLITSAERVCVGHVLPTTMFTPTMRDFDHCADTKTLTLRRWILSNVAPPDAELRGCGPRMQTRQTTITLYFCTALYFCPGP